MPKEEDAKEFVAASDASVKKLRGRVDGVEERLEAVEQTVVDLKTEVGHARQRLGELETAVAVSLRQIAELVGDDGGLAKAVRLVEDELRALRADVRITDDALGDSQTVDSLTRSVEQIKRQLGIG